MDDKTVGFIGGGNMAFAIAKGLVVSGVVKADKIIASAKTQTRLENSMEDVPFQELGTKTTLSNVEVVNFADIVFLAVKPHILPGVLDELTSQTKSFKNLFVSVAAGVTLDFMQEKLCGARVIRTMTNTPCLVQSGVVVYSCGKECSQSDSDILQSMLGVVGYVEEVEEKQIDAMSSLMGCSIAWFLSVIEAMSDGGVKDGVPRQISYKLVAKAMEGAAKLFCESGKHVGQLKDEVTSPSGSTICGLYELEQAGVRGAFMKAVGAATKRNKELGSQ